MGLLDMLNRGFDNSVGHLNNFKDSLASQQQMYDPHANARRLMGGAVQEPQPTAQPAVQPQSLLPQGTPQEPSMTPYQQPQNIGSGVMGYDRDLTGINNVGHQAGPETQTYLTANGAIDNRNVGGYTEENVGDLLKEGYDYDTLGWDDDYNNTYSHGSVLQGQGNDSNYTPMGEANSFTDTEGQLISGYPQAFVQQKEAGGAENPNGNKVEPADIPLSVVTGDTRYTKPEYTAESLLGSGGNFGFENADEEAIIKLLEADNRRSNGQKFLDRGRDLFGFRNTKKY